MSVNSELASNVDCNRISKALDVPSTSRDEDYQAKDTRRVMTDRNKFNENKLLCQLHHLPSPINYRKFNKLIWNYVTTFDRNNLRAGSTFKSIGELASMKRKFSDIPLCRPGPLKREEYYDWYSVDTIVQEIYLNCINLKY